MISWIQFLSWKIYEICHHFQLVAWKNLYLSLNDSILKKSVLKLFFIFQYNWMSVKKCSTLQARGVLINRSTQTHEVSKERWYLSFGTHFLNCAMDEATTAYWKSGLILSSFKILIFVLSNKAVLGSNKYAGVVFSSIIMRFHIIGTARQKC